MFEYWSLVMLLIIGFTFLGYLIYLLGKKSMKKETGKEKIYTCGEPFSVVGISSESFYESIKKNLRFEKLKFLQSGKLSDYLLWILVGLTILIILVRII